MKLVVLTPERDRPDEHAVLAALFAAGLERCHVRKPGVSREALQRWLTAVPERWRSRLVLHQHHDLAPEAGAGGVHWSERERAALLAGPAELRRIWDNAPFLTSTSCHALAALPAVLGRFQSVFYGPLFPSLSKPGYEPREGEVGEALAAVLHARTQGQARTTVLALGGLTPAHVGHAAALGFDGIAVIGAVWQADDPVAAFHALHDACEAAAVPLC